MQITSIKLQVKTPGRYSIYVDGKYSFSLSDSALLEDGLTTGQELSREQLKEFRQHSADDKLYNQVLRFATLRPRSVWEIEQYLNRKHASPALAKTLLNKLSKVGIVDDEAFARNWIDNRQLLKPTSLRRLRLELRTKHVADEVIDRAMNDNQPNELQTLRAVIDKKGSRYSDPQKLMRYLASQGFSYGDIKTILQEEA